MNNRLVVWFVTQQHTYFGGFVLALPLFSLLLEFLGVTRKQEMARQQFDGLAQDILRVGLLSLSITAVLGSVMLGLFVTLYPGFMNYMGSTFKSLMPVYAAVFVGEAFLLALYYYTWETLEDSGSQVGAYVYWPVSECDGCDPVIVCQCLGVIYDGAVRCGCGRAFLRKRVAFVAFAPMEPPQCASIFGGYYVGRSGSCRVCRVSVF